LSILRCGNGWFAGSKEYAETPCRSRKEQARCQASRDSLGAKTRFTIGVSCSGKGGKPIASVSRAWKFRVENKSG